MVYTEHGDNNGIVPFACELAMEIECGQYIVVIPIILMSLQFIFLLNKKDT